MKTCTRCGLEKPESEYYWSKVQNNYVARCKVCTREYRKGYYYKVHEKVPKDPTTRTCCDCKIKKPKSDFYSGQWRCKLCWPSSSRTYYEKNKDKVLEKSAEYKANNILYVRKWHNGHRQKRAEQIKEIQLLTGCIKCGIKDHRVLQFHHRDRTIKSFTIGKRSANRKWEDVLLEIEKCDVLCANCHAIYHYEERNGNCIYHTGTD